MGLSSPQQGRDMAKRNVIHYEWHNQPQEAFGYKFKSKAEYRWAQYLNMLCKLGAIHGWDYEPKKFEFKERYRKRRVYTPDFCVFDDGEYIYHEVKTSMRQVDVRRFKYMNADYPDIKMVLVLVSKPKGKTTPSRKQIVLIDNARKYVERVVYAGPLYRKFGIK